MKKQRRASIKDTDYLALSARLRAMENDLLGTERMEQILSAPTDAEALRLLQSFGYPALDPARPEAMDEAIGALRQEMFEDLGESAPDARLVESFRVPYDYHNLKVLLKAEALETDASSMLSGLGRVEVSALREALRDGGELPGHLAEAAAEAREVLSTTRDPQLADTTLDRWYYRDLAELAEATGSGFLSGYVRAQIDAANLRTLVRTLRMGKGAEFLRGVLFEGGETAEEEILRVSANGGAGLAELYASTRFAAAAESGAAALRGGLLTEFEKRCDDAVSACLEPARLIPFGEAPLVAYLAERETEFMNLRILLMGRGAGLPASVIRERLRAGALQKGG